MMIGNRIFGALLIGAAFAPRPASAAVTDLFDNAIGAITSGFEYLWPDKVDRDKVRLRLGVGFGTSPDYLGSNNYRLRVLPLIDLRYKDTMVLQGSKVRFNIVKTGDFKAGPLVNYKFGRNASNNAILEGWGHVGDTWQVGAFAEVQKKHMLISVDLRRALGSNMGYEANGLIAHGLYKGEKLTLFAGARTKWSSKDYNQTVFGVTTAQSTVSGLPEFHPGSGFSSADLNLIARYQIRDKLFLESLVGNMVILDKVGDSPLVDDKGSRHQMIGGFGLRYVF